MMRKLTIPGIFWVFPVFILAMGGCKLVPDSTDKNSSKTDGSLGKETKLELSTQLKSLTGDTAVSNDTYDGVVTDETGLFTDGKIVQGKLSGSITYTLSGNYNTLDSAAVSALVNFNFPTLQGKEFFNDIKLSADDVNYAELKLQVKRSDNSTKQLGNEKIGLTGTYEMGTWVWVSKNVTITGKKQAQNFMVVTVTPSKDLELKLTQGWNCIYRELKTLGTSYSVSLKNYDHWYAADTSTLIP